MRTLIRILAMTPIAWASPALAGTPPTWTHLTSGNGDLPVPGSSTQQTAALILDANGDAVSDFVIGCRQSAPALTLFLRQDTGWSRQVIEPERLTIEAGGAAHDIDGDGDVDIVFGGDWQSQEVWWWENPGPNPDGAAWRRYRIKGSGATQHHDQTWGDFLGTGRPQLAFWNQNAKKIFLAEIPADPARASEWPLITLYSGDAGAETFRYPEGMSTYDVDGDGQLDLLAGNTWFKHRGGKSFQATRIADVGGLIFAGHFKPGRYPQIVIAPGDGVGVLMLHECTGDPLKASDWTGRALVDRDMIHGHSLQVADIDADGNLDIFAAEMAKWGRQPNPDHPDAAAWIFYGDGKGNFQRTLLVRGHGWHEARIADLDGDGDLDILNKPYTWETPRLDVWMQDGGEASVRDAVRITQ